MQDKVYKTYMTELDVLKHRIQTEWANLEHAVIAASVHQWRRCISGRVKAGDGHFKHCDVGNFAFFTTFIAKITIIYLNLSKFVQSTRNRKRHFSRRHNYVIIT